MVPLSITVSPPHVHAVRAALLTLYRLEAEALQRACDAYLRDRRSTAGVLMRRAALLEVDALLEQAGWELGGDPPATERTLIAEAELLEETLYAALLEALEQLELRVREAWREDVDPDALRIAVQAVDRFVDLLGEVRAARGGEGRRKASE